MAVIVILFNDKNVSRVMRTQGVILGLFVFICFATSFCSSLSSSSSTTSVAASKIGACESVATHFQSKGFSITQLPEEPTNGALCGKNSCCSSTTFEKELTLSMKQQLNNFLYTSLNRVSILLDKRAKRFDNIFKDMMNKSKKEFDEMFKKTYGLIYLQNSVVFTDFFEDLERYYNKGNIKLSDALENFFTILYQRMFKVINAQYKFDEKYLSCVAEHMTELKPFGDVPNKLGVQLKRSFIATRTFYKAITIAASVTSKLQNLKLSDDCIVDMVRMQYCGLCTTRPLDYRGTCFKYCNHIAAECFKHFITLNKKWDDFVDAIEKVGKRLVGPFNIEMVVEPINIKISDAVMTFQENGADVSKKVFSGCGNPVLGRRKRAAAAGGGARDQKKLSSSEIAFQPLYAGNANINNNNNNNNNNNKKKTRKDNKHADDKVPILERQISDIIETVKNTRQMWTYLPVQYCNNNNITSSDLNCWNGTKLEDVDEHSTGTTTTTSTIPRTSSSRTPTQILEQIFTLEVWIGKLQGAHQGQEVDLVDDSEDTLTDDDGTSGSGSGDFPIDSPTGDDDEGDDDNDDGNISKQSTNDITSTTTTTTESTMTITNRTLLNNDINNNVPPGSSSTSNAQLPSLSRALIQYILPIVFVCFGGAISDLL